MPFISNDTHNLYNYMDLQLICDKEIFKGIHFKVEKDIRSCKFFLRKGVKKEKIKYADE